MHFVVVATAEALVALGAECHEHERAVASADHADSYCGADKDIHFRTRTQACL
jgi:hypothetical protein